MLATDQSNQLDEILGTSIAEFDIPDAVYARAVARYEHLAHWLADYWPDPHAGGEVYPQGSVRLGTVTCPVDPRDEIDVDLVCRRDLLETSITKQDLKSDVGLGLARYVATRPDGAPTCAEGGRCWTLEYSGEPFHMDVLPALPDTEALPNGILLTDRELWMWQHSNPVDFADWFRGRMAAEFITLREASAIAKRMDVEDVPYWQVKTTLQRTVQALKRHRDLHFVDAPKDKPASIVITTLAARAYRGQGSLFEVLVDVVQRMPAFIEDRDGILWIPNPVQAEENFADRWRKHPDRAQRFFDWIGQAQLDFAGLGEERGLHRVVSKLAESFGSDPANRAGERFGTGMRNARERGLLGIGAGTGTLGAVRSRPVPQHTFHGDGPRPIRSQPRTAGVRLARLIPGGARGPVSEAPDLERNDHADGAQPCLPRQHHLPLAPVPGGAGARSRARDAAGRIHPPPLQQRDPVPTSRRRVVAGHARRRHNSPVDLGVVAQLRALARYGQLVRRRRVAAAPAGKLHRDLEHGEGGAAPCEPAAAMMRSVMRAQQPRWPAGA